MDPTTELIEKKRQFLADEVEPLLEEGTERVAPPCPLFSACGGCHLQFLPYPAQLAYKQALVGRCLEREGVTPPEGGLPIRGMDDPWHYRNKTDFNAWFFPGGLKLGFSEFGTSRVVETAHCMIASGSINEALAGFSSVLPTHPRIKRKIHSVVLRSGDADRQSIAFYHAKVKDADEFGLLTREVKEIAPRLKGGAFVHNRRLIAEGNVRLSEEIEGVRYEYSPSAFFQANPVQTAVLVREVLRMAAVKPDDVVMDLYSGVGLFGMQLARHADTVLQIEDNRAAVEDARANAKANGIENCRFLGGMAEDQLRLVETIGPRPDVIVLDPPRSGCSEQVLETLCRLAARHVVYVSCHPASLARDLKFLGAHGYQVDEIVLVDMFPQTVHVETVVKLTRTGGR